MTPIFSIKFSIQLRNNNRKLCGVFASLFSSKTLNPPSSPDSLFQRVQIIRDPKSSLLPVLEQWVNEGRGVQKSQLQYLVRTMKDFKRFHHALQISQWMTDCRYLPLSPHDVAIRLNLISRVKGIEHVESYFNAVSVNLKTYIVYGSLLSVYVREKSVEKAEAIMQKMKEMGLATSSFPYNMLISLYTQTGDFEKIEAIVQEMDEKGIPHDKHTMRNRMVFYVAASDISRMERILDMMEKDPHFVIDWKIYSMAANGYAKVGLIEKAVLMLKKLEGVMPCHRKKLALQFLITLYTNIGMKDELYRVWNMYKGMDGNMDTTYACMITSLAKLDDFEGAEKIFEEWESQCAMYDFRVLNKLLVAYCRKGLLEKAESALKNAAKGRMPFAMTWIVLAIGYTEHNQMPKAVEMLKKAISIGRQGWWPNSIILNACLDYLEEQGDVTGIEDMIKSLKNLGPLTRDIYHRWLRACVAPGDSVSRVLDHMKMDGYSSDEETQKILETRPNF